MQVNSPAHSQCDLAWPDTQGRPNLQRATTAGVRRSVRRGLSQLASGACMTVENSLRVEFSTRTGMTSPLPALDRVPLRRREHTSQWPRRDAGRPVREHVARGIWIAGHRIVRQLSNAKAQFAFKGSSVVIEAVIGHIDRNFSSAARAVVWTGPGLQHPELCRSFHGESCPAYSR